MDKHVTIVGYLFIAFGIIGLVGAFFGLGRKSLCDNISFIWNPEKLLI